MNNDQAIEQEIQAKGKTAPRVTPDSIKAVIVSEHYFTAGEGVIGAFAAGEFQKNVGDVTLPAGAAHPDLLKPSLNLLTFCVLVLKNGFTVTGKSACASPENFDADIGRKVAFQDAMQQIWPLEGYSLKQRLFESSQLPHALEGAALVEHFNDLQRQYLAAGEEIAIRGGMAGTGRPAYQQRVVDEHDELSSKIDKLAGFLPTPTFARLAEDEQRRLGHQLDAMRDYAAILYQRIAAFPAA